MSDHRRIVIVGAGCFGSSTAYHLLRRGFVDVTILERSPVIPAVDAASSDFNKVVRTSYADPFYSKLAAEAMELWRDTKEWGDTYHECGALLLRKPVESRKGYFFDRAYENDIALGARLERLESTEAIRGIFPPHVPVGAFSGLAGYLNHTCGWAFASQGVSLMMSKVAALGGKVIPDKSVDKLLERDGKTCGVHCEDGSTYEADLVILASGAWTAAKFPSLNLGQNLLATGQCVATIQLTEDESEQYRGCPVVINFEYGFHVFPPTADNVVKIATHRPGYTNPFESSSGSISSPRTVTTDGEDGKRIPIRSVHELRRFLKEIYPALAGKPFASTRLCWYTDTPDEDWIIGYPSSDPGLFLATGGSGHGYKFLPIFGRVAVDIIEGKDPELTKKFAVNRTFVYKVGSRTAQGAEALPTDQLCSPGDMLGDNNPAE